MNRIPLFLLTLFMLAACGPVPKADTPLSAEWTVTLTQSGGFAGVMRTVTVSSDGTASAADQRETRNAAVELSPEELAAVESAVGAVWLDHYPDSYPNRDPDSYPNPGRKDSGCADCFIYDIEIRMGDDRFKVQFDDVTLPGSGFEDLVTALRAVMDRILAGQ